MSGFLTQVPWSPLWQGLLNGIGWLVGHIYQVIPNYGLTIIALTVLIRLVLLPLGIKQIRSMQNMQALSPKVKALQQKYKGNKAKQQEETMKLYREMGVNPLSGCWPMLLQLPILVSMYSVLRYPQHPPHIPADTKLYQQIQANLTAIPQRPLEGTTFAGTNLLCSASQAGNPKTVVTDTRGPKTADGKQATFTFDCGSPGVATKIPYYLFAVLMFGTTYYQQRQMTKATPGGAANPQQQQLMKIMPLMFGVFGFFFPVGLVIYWTVSNLWQIGQQHFVLKARKEILPDLPRKPAKKGFMGRMLEQAEQERKRRDGAGDKKPNAAKKRPRPGAKKPQPRSNPNGSGKKPSTPKKPGSGGTGAGSRKKRPKR